MHRGLRTVGSILAFLRASVLFRLLPWHALAFLDEASATRNIIVGAVCLAATALLTALLVRRFPTMTPAGYALLPRRGSSSVRDVLAGSGVGAALFAAVFATVVMLGGLSSLQLRVAPGELAAAVMAALGGIVLSAAWEEYAFRGWAFLVGVRALVPHPPALGIGVIFGCLHMLNPAWTLAAVVSVCAAGCS